MLVLLGVVFSIEATYAHRHKRRSSSLARGALPDLQPCLELLFGDSIHRRPIDCTF